MLGIPAYWLRPPERLSAAAGFHRFVWDMHYPPVPGIKPEYPISAVYKNTAPQPTSPWIIPGPYKVVLTVEGQHYEQPLTVAMDPRVKTPQADLQRQFELSLQVYQELLNLQPVILQAESAQEKLKSMRAGVSQAQAQKIDEVIGQLKALLGGGTGRRRRGQQAENLTGLRSSLLQLLTMLQEADVAPTTQAAEQVPAMHTKAATAMQRWNEFASAQLKPLNVAP